MGAAIEVTGRAFARAALLGNPSDGFGGKTIAFIVREFAADVTIGEAAAPRIAAEAGARDLIEAASARFARLCRARGIGVRPVTARLHTDIPQQVGLGGSSAIVIATLRGLAQLHRLELPPATLAALALEVETDELGIPAGPQDRVVQAYEGLVYMDFGRDAPAAAFELLDPGLLPPHFIAYMPAAAQPSGATHGELRRRFERGDRRVIEALEEIAALAVAGRRCLLDGDGDRLGRLMEANVEARSRLVELDPRHLRMIEIARSLGAAANYAGSGGAIVGLLGERADPQRVRQAFAAEGCGLLLAA